MKKLLILLRVYLRGALRLRLRGGGRLKGKLGTAATVLLALLLYGMFAFYTVWLGVGLNIIGLIQVYPVMVGAIVSLFTLITSISRAPGTLFRARDFDLVMSLPIPGRTVAAARLIELYAAELLFAAAIMVPAGGAYAYFTHPSALFYPAYLALILLTPLVPMLLGAALGALVQVVSAAFRGSRVISLVLTFVVTLAVMTLSYGSGFFFADMTQAQFFDLANMITDMFGRIYPPVLLLGRAIVEGDALAFAGFAALSLGAFALLAWVLGRWFVPLQTWVNARHTRGDAHVREQREKSPRAALLAREARRYFASNVYVMNTGFGLLLSLLGAGALAFFKLDRLVLLLELTGYEQLVSMLVPFVVTFMVSTACTTGCSISMEGRQLWIAKMLPVRAIDYLMAKVRLNLLIVLPFVAVDGLLLAYALRLSPAAAALSLLLPLAMAVFTALTGLLSNLKWHRFDWTNETTVVKQSFAAFLPVLAGMVLIMGACVLTVLVPHLGHALVPLLTAGVLAIADVCMYLLLRTRAEEWVRQL